MEALLTVCILAEHLQDVEDGSRHVRVSSTRAKAHRVISQALHKLGHLRYQAAVCHCDSVSIAILPLQRVKHLLQTLKPVRDPMLLPGKIVNTLHHIRSLSADLTAEKCDRLTFRL